MKSEFKRQAVGVSTLDGLIFECNIVKNVLPEFQTHSSVEGKVAALQSIYDEVKELADRAHTLGVINTNRLSNHATWIGDGAIAEECRITKGEWSDSLASEHVALLTPQQEVFYPEDTKKVGKSARYMKSGDVYLRKPLPETLGAMMVTVLTGDHLLNHLGVVLEHIESNAEKIKNSDLSVHRKSVAYASHRDPKWQPAVLEQ